MRPEEVGRAKQDLRLDLRQQSILGNINIIIKTWKQKGRYTRKNLRKARRSGKRYNYDID